MEKIREEGLMPYVDSTYNNNLTNVYPVIYLTENELFAKLYAFLRCYGNKIKKFIYKKYKLSPTPKEFSRMVFLESVDGKPEVATVNIEVDDSGSNKSPYRQDAQLFSNDLNTKEFMVFRLIEPMEIVKIEPVKETISQICTEILRTGNPVAIKASQEYKKRVALVMSLQYGGKIVVGHNMFDITKMISESPEINDFLLRK
jgi:hypothetical protein